MDQNEAQKHYSRLVNAAAFMRRQHRLQAARWLESAAAYIANNAGLQPDQPATLIGSADNEDDDDFEPREPAGLYAQLTSEQQEAARSHDGPPMTQQREIAPGLTVQHDADGYWILADADGHHGMISTARMGPGAREAFEAVIRRLLGEDET